MAVKLCVGGGGNKGCLRGGVEGVGSGTQTVACRHPLPHPLKIPQNCHTPVLLKLLFSIGKQLLSPLA